MTVEAIILAAMQLPDDDRAQIAHQLLASLPSDDPQYLKDLADEIESRSAEVMSGTFEGSDAAESLDRMDQALARRKTS